MEGTTKGVDLLSRLLGAAELRARVISTNISNQNTPGYTRQVVRFEELLRDKAVKGRLDEARGVEPQLALDRESPTRPDGNNVDLEVELTALRENRLLYETYAAMLRGHFDLMRTAVTEGR